MTQRYADYFPERINLRVPLNSFEAASVDKAGSPNLIEWGKTSGVIPTVSATAVLNAVAYASTATVITAGLPYKIATTGGTATEIKPFWGQCLNMVAAVSTSTAAVTIRGRDYLGQRVAETQSLNGLTTVTFLKALSYVDSVSIAAGDVATTISVGTRNKFGLPSRAVLLSGSIMDGISVTAHTFTVPDDTNPGTATTGDPRGTLAFNTTPNGTHTYGAQFIFDTSGNLHGVYGQFYA